LSELIIDDVILFMSSGTLSPLPAVSSKQTHPPPVRVVAYMVHQTVRRT